MSCDSRSRGRPRLEALVREGEGTLNRAHLAVVFMLGGSISASQADSPRSQPSPTTSIDNRPSTTPQRSSQVSLVRAPYLQLVTPTSVTVAWRSGTATDSRVDYFPDGDTTVVTVADAAVTVDHFVTISGLTPATRYRYTIGSTSELYGGGTDDHYFVTAPPSGAVAPFRVWVCGDGGTGGLMQRSVMNAMLAVAGDDPPDIALYLGDLAYNDGTDWEFTTRCFEPYEPILRNTVLWPVLGNHDARSIDPRTGTGPYFDAFVLPKEGEAGGVPSATESYYSYDYGNAHFIALDTAISNMGVGSPMLTWLAADLAQAASQNHDWLIAFLHHPPYCKGTHDSDNAADSGGRMRDARENVVPLLEAAGVDLVFAGHSHAYERSYLIQGAHGYGSPPDYATPDYATLSANGNIVDAGDGEQSGDGPYSKPPVNGPFEGTVYVVAGHGGNTTGLNGLHPVMHTAEADFGSVLIDVGPTELTVRNIRYTGVVSDTFSIINACGGHGECDDANPCTDDICDDGRCEHIANWNPCDDGDPCTANDVCHASVCSGDPPPFCPEGAPCDGDCNQNGVRDVCDTHTGVSEDCDGDLIPDSCQPDTDGNGVIDACEESFDGFTADSDGDGVPDLADGCPNDPNKVEPGACGCGEPESGDDDGDGVPDCIDICPGLDDGTFAPGCAGAIPAISAWGLMILALLLLTASKIAFRRQRNFV